MSGARWTICRSRLSAVSRELSRVSRKRPESDAVAAETRRRRRGRHAGSPVAHRRCDVRSLLQSWLREERGQDLLEYMLLGAVIAFAGALAFSYVSDAMNSTYTSW